MTKLIYLGCLSSSKFKETCDNARKVIKFLDDQYEVLTDPPCCGALAYHVTDDKELKQHVEFVNNWFKSNKVTNIVTICAGCYNYLTRYYPQYLGSEFEIEVKHLLQFIAIPENLQKLNLKYEGKKLTVNYHDACHLRNAVTPILDEPREIFNSIENVELKEMVYNKENTICCGAGGGVYSIFKENSDYSSKFIFEHMKGGKILLTACPFCYTSFKRIKQENDVMKPVLKFEDFIVKLMEGVEPTL